MYLRLSELSLGILGLRRAPLKIIMKSKMPRKAPCGEDQGKDLREEVAPLNLMNIDLPVR